MTNPKKSSLELRERLEHLRGQWRLPQPETPPSLAQRAAPRREPGPGRALLASAVFLAAALALILAYRSGQKKSSPSESPALEQKVEKLEEEVETIKAVTESILTTLQEESGRK